MKKLFFVSLLMVSTGIAHADAPRLVNADGSELSAVCIAAVTSREAMHAKVAELGIGDFDARELRCNGQTLARFVSTHRPVAGAEPAPAAFVFNKSDDTPVTELCLAAVRSEQEYANVKERHFSKDETIEAEVRCNGLPLEAFARKYRVSAQDISLR